MPAQSSYDENFYGLEKKMAMIFAPLVIIGGASSMIDNAMSEESSINKCIAINQNFSNAAERYAELMYATVPTPQGQTQASAYLRSTDNGGFLPWGGDYCTINVPVFEAK